MNQPVPAQRDSALRYTAGLAHDLLQGRRPTSAATVYAPFPTQFAADEQLWSIGPFRLYELRAPGDGSYVEDQSWFVATGGLGLALTAAVYGARKVGNDRRRREAEAALVPRWIEIGAGDLYTGTHGFYVHPPAGLWSWSWNDVQSSDVRPRPAAVHRRRPRRPGQLVDRVRLGGTAVPRVGNGPAPRTPAGRHRQLVARRLAWRSPDRPGGPSRSVRVQSPTPPPAAQVWWS